MDVAARRLAWGKFLNAGQTCVAPDYVLVAQAASKSHCWRPWATGCQRFYGARPGASPASARVVNDAHMDRLVELLEATKGRVVMGGQLGRPPHRYLAPTVLADVDWDDPLMEEEIFGPILPVAGLRRRGPRPWRN